MGSEQESQSVESLTAGSLTWVLIYQRNFAILWNGSAALPSILWTGLILAA